MRRIIGLARAQGFLLGHLVILSFAYACTGDGRPYPTPVITQHNSRLHILWSFGAGYILEAPLQIGSGTIISGYDDYNEHTFVWLGVDNNSGKLLWKYPRQTGGWPGISLIAGERLILGYSGPIEVLDALSGQLKWTAGDYSIVQSIAANPETVFVASREGVEALELASGVSKWYNPGLPRYALQLLFDEWSNRLILIDAPSPYSNIYVIDPLNGSVLRQLRLDDDQLGSCGADELKTDFVFHKWRLYCLPTIVDIESKQLVADENTLGYIDFHLSSPTIAAGTLYFVTQHSTVQAIDLDTLVTKWEYRLEDSSTNILSGVVIMGETGYVTADDDTVRLVNLAEGEETGRIQIQGLELSPYDSFVTDGTRLYLKNHGWIIALAP